MKPIEFNGFGFPVLLLGFKHRRVGKEKVLDVNYQELTKTVLRALIMKKGRLTGAELRFIRNEMGMSQSDFARMIGKKDHSSISKWESRKLRVADMDAATEAIIRIKLADSCGERFTKKLFSTVFDDVRESNAPGELLKIEAA